MKAFLQTLKHSLYSFSSAYWILWSGTFVNRMGTLVLPFLAIYLSVTLHTSSEQAGFILAIPGLGSIVSALLVSALADRWDRKKLLVGVLLTSSLAVLFIPFLSSLWILAIIVLIWSILSEAQRPLSGVLLTDVIPEEKRQQAVSFLRIGINVGSSVGTTLGGLLATFSFLPLAIIDAATTVFFAFLTLFRFPSLHSQEKEHAEHFTLRSWIASLKARPLQRLLLSTFMGTLIYSQLTTTFVLYLLKIGGNSLWYGFLMALSSLFVVFVEFPLVVAIAKIQEARVMAFGCLFMGLGAALCATISGATFLIIPIMIFTVGEMLFFPSSGALGANIAPEEQRGLYIGFQWVADGLGFVLGPIIGGLLLSISPLLCWSVFGVCGGIGALSIFSLRLSPNEALKEKEAS